MRPNYDVEQDRPGWVVGSGKVAVTATPIVISHATDDGAKWRVEYRRVKDPDWLH